MSESLFIILILLVIVMMYMFIFSNHKYTHYPISTFNDIKHKFKTGDIIIFSCPEHNNDFIHAAGNYIYKRVYRSIFIHVGMIIKLGNILYFIELCGPSHAGKDYAIYLNESNNEGVRIIKLDDCIREYYEKYGGLFAVKYLDKPLNPNIVLSLLDQYKDYTFRTSSEITRLSLCSLIYPQENIKYDPKKMICTEFIHSILNKCGVFKNYPSHLFFPQHFSDSKYCYLQNIKYSDVHLFIYN